MTKTGAELAKVWEKQFKSTNLIIVKCPVTTEAELQTILNDFVIQVQSDGYTQNDLNGWRIAATAGYVILQKQ